MDSMIGNESIMGEFDLGSKTEESIWDPNYFDGNMIILNPLPGFTLEKDDKII